MVFADIEKVALAFGYKGTFKAMEEIRAGHINCTYKITYTEQSGKENAYIIQKINTVAFRDPDRLMGNIGKVVEHLAQKIDPSDLESERRFLHFLKTNYYMQNLLLFVDMVLNYILLSMYLSPFNSINNFYHYL